MSCKRETSGDREAIENWQAPQGSYEGNCFIDGNAILRQFAKIVYKFNGSNMSFAINAYDDSEICDPSSQYSTQKTEYAFSKPSDTENLIKLTTQEGSLTLSQTVDVEWAKEKSYCGHSEWEVDLPVVLSGKTCENGPVFEEAGTERYLSVILNGSTITVDSVDYQTPE